MKHSVEGAGTDCGIGGDLRAMRFRTIDGKETTLPIEFGPGKAESWDKSYAHPCMMVNVPAAAASLDRNLPQ